MSLLLLFPTAAAPVTVVAPTVTTDLVSSILSNSAVGDGTVTSDGGGTITARGFVYATTQNPTTSNTKVVVTGTVGPYTGRLAGLLPNTTYYVRAYATNSAGTSYGSQLSLTTRRIDIVKHYFYRVLDSTGLTLKAVWTKEVISEPNFTNVINSGPGELNVRLGRQFDNFGEDDDVALNNLVEVYCVDADAVNGLLIYKGYISGYKPVVQKTQEYVDVTLFPLDAELQRMVLRDAAGNTTVAYNSYDPSNILKDVMDQYRRLGGRLNYSPTSITLTNTIVSYTFNTNTIKECLEKVIELCPAGWYYRIDPNGIIYLLPKSDTAIHTFTLGWDIENLETYRRVEDLVNRVLLTGGGSPNLFRMYETLSSQTSYGLYEVKVVDERITLAATASVVANSLLNARNSPEIRSTFTIIDNNGPRSRGYNIESVKVGDTLKVKNLKIGSQTSTLWDVGLWDTDFWDQTIASQAADVVQILSIRYSPDSIEIEASSRLPQVAKRIEDINRNLQDSITVDNPSAPS